MVYHEVAPVVTMHRRKHPNPMTAAALKALTTATVSISGWASSSPILTLLRHSSRKEREWKGSVLLLPWGKEREKRRRRRRRRRKEKKFKKLFSGFFFLFFSLFPPSCRRRRLFDVGGAPKRAH